MPSTCPVCGYPGLEMPARTKSGGGSYEICPSCGFQFGVDDEDRGETYAGWRERWIAAGSPWRSSRPAPEGWDAAAQLRVAGLSGERGQTSAEYLGILFIVALLVAAIVHAGVDRAIASTVKHQIDCIASACDPPAGGDQGGSTPGTLVPGLGGAAPGGGGGPQGESPLAGRVRDAAGSAKNAPDDVWGRPETLQDHFDRHGGDFDVPPRPGLTHGRRASFRRSFPSPPGRARRTAAAEGGERALVSGSDNGDEPSVSASGELTGLGAANPPLEAEMAPARRSPRPPPR